MSIRVAVVDAHTLIRYGLSALIDESPDLVAAGTADTLAASRALIAQTRPNVVTLGISLPDGDGLELARELRDRYADLGIVVLTMRGEDDVLFRVMETGASAFVAKTAPTSEILGAIRHAAVAASSFTAVGLPVALARRGREQPDRPALSPRELEVLRLLGAGMSVPAIAGEMFLSPSTAKTYVARLYEKLGVGNRAQALMTALRRGLIQYETSA